MLTNNLIEKNYRLNPAQKAGLNKLGLETLEDLLFYLPSRYATSGKNLSIKNIDKGKTVTIFGKIVKQETKKAWRSKIPMAEMTIDDGTSKIKAVWFHQAYMAKKFNEGTFVQATGTIQDRKGKLYMANPILDLAPQTIISDFSMNLEDDTGLIPIYPETKGISSLWFYSHVNDLLKKKVNEEINDPIPEEILKKYNLPTLKTALVWIHSPKNEKDALAARKRFSFQEIFLIQVKRLQAKNEYRERPTYSISVSNEEVSEFIDRFPFKPTKAQNDAINTIIEDLKKKEPMTRLLEGDVGSGKTAVAASTAYGVVTTHPYGKDYGNLQVAYMAPTEILARQHFESFIEYFKHLPIQIGLITGSECRKFPSKIDPSGHTHVSRKKLLDWVKSGEIPILIGTHALIQKSVEFKHLTYVIIDEQHRFGTMQRAKLTRKDEGKVPHLLSMTATPIPRTLALTIFGDLDLTLLDEMPVGRKPIVTNLISPNERENTYESVRAELKSGRQVYIICPRIDEPDPTKEMAILAKSVKEEAKRLKKDVFPEYEIEILHSKMKPKEKEEVMESFANHKIDILVATSVVEVGVNVPNATVIIIEGAERFGLSQLHQLRGRVLRSSHQAYCYLFSDSKSEKTTDRLKALKNAKNGFELSEIDLKLRGAGSLIGSKQWGISDIGMEAIQNLKMVEAARNEANLLLKKDKKLSNHPLIKERLSKQIVHHFE